MEDGSNGSRSGSCSRSQRATTPTFPSSGEKISSAESLIHASLTRLKCGRIHEGAGLRHAISGASMNYTEVCPIALIPVSKPTVVSQPKKARKHWRFPRYARESSASRIRLYRQYRYRGIFFWELTMERMSVSS